MGYIFSWFSLSIYQFSTRKISFLILDSTAKLLILEQHVISMLPRARGHWCQIFLHQSCWVCATNVTDSSASSVIGIKRGSKGKQCRWTCMLSVLFTMRCVACWPALVLLKMTCPRFFLILFLFKRKTGYRFIGSLRVGHVQPDWTPQWWMMASGTSLSNAGCTTPLSARQWGMLWKNMWHFLQLSRRCWKHLEKYAFSRIWQWTEANNC
jgi:hypothetical protein